MCLAIPAEVIKILDDERAIVNIGGVTREISTLLLTEVSQGDYVIIHVGYALTKLDQLEAKKTIQIFVDMLQQGENI